MVWITIIQIEIRRLLAELDQLKDKSVRAGNTQFAARLAAMSQAVYQPVTLPADSINVSSNCLNKLGNGPANLREADKETRYKTSHNKEKKEKNKSPKNSPESGIN